MKRVKYSIVFVMILAFGISDTQAQERFRTIVMDTINVSFSPRENSVLLLNDGGYLIRCQIDEWDPKLKKYIRRVERISKYDINGNRLWYKDFTDFYLSGICELYDGSIALCGGRLIRADPDQFRYAYIVKLDPCGEVEWAKMDEASNYGTPGAHTMLPLRTVIDTGDGLIFPFRFDEVFWDENIGYTYDFRTELLKLDYDGNIVYRTRFEYYGRNQEIWGGGVDSEGNIWMSGSCSAPHSYDPSSALSSPLVVKCDSEGNLLYIKSAKDDEIDFYGTSLLPHCALLIDDDNTFFTIPPLSVIVPSANDKDAYISSKMIKVDKECNLTTHTIENDDYDPEYTNYMFGLDFIDGQEHLITSSRYICRDNEWKGGKYELRHGMEDNCYTINDNRYLLTSALPDRNKKSTMDDYDDFLLTCRRNMICIIDREGKIIDSLRMENDYTLHEVTEGVITVENNNFLVISLDMGTADYITRIRKFNRDFEPALIDNTPREYDKNCDRPIKSGLVKPRYESLVSVSDVVEEPKPIRFSPNPANDKTRVYLSNGFGEKRLEVYDITGKLCRVHTIDEGWAQSDLYVSDLPSGVYVVKLIVGGKLKGTEKLIVN